MADLGTAYVNIVPKAPGISNNISELLSGAEPAAERAGTSFGQKIGAGLKIAGAGIAVAAGAVIKQAFEAGGNLQQSFGGLETIYGDAAEGAKQYAMAAAAAGISANTYAEQAVSMGAALKQAFGGDTQAAAEAANTAIMDMADNAAKMGTPIESLQSAYQGFAKQNYTMLDNLKLGYGGTKEEMQRLLADAEAFSGVKYDIDNLGDVYEAIHVVQEEMGLTGVAAEEASTTLTGSTGAMKASWENLMAALATGEGLDQAVANFSSSFSAFATNVIGIFAQLAPQLPELVSGLAQILIDNAPTFIAAGVELIVQLGVGLIEAIPDIVAMIPDMFSKIIDAVKGIDWAGLGKDIVDGIINGIGAKASALLDSLKSLASNALQSAKKALQIESPSKAFANEVGRWIPAGVALGVERNMDPLDRAMRDMADGSVTAMRSDLRPVGAAAGSDADRIITALQNLRLQADVSLEGDARQIFKVVNRTNAVRTKATNYNALAAGG